MLSTTLRRVALLALTALAACSDGPAPTATPDAATTTPGLDAAELLRLQEWEQREKARTAANWAIAQNADSVRPSLGLLGGLTGTLTGTVSDVLTSPVLLCNPLQYAADTKIIGPEGGVLQIGPHQLVIPRGALRQHTVITGEVPLLSLAPSVKLSPHGLRFERPAELTLSYKHCLVRLGVVHAVAYTDEDLNVLEWPRSQDWGGGRVTGYIWHFSRYAVARRSSYATSW